MIHRVNLLIFFNFKGSIEKAIESICPKLEAIKGKGKLLKSFLPLCLLSPPSFPSLSLLFHNFNFVLFVSILSPPPLPLSPFLSLNFIKDVPVYLVGINFGDKPRTSILIDQKVKQLQDICKHAKYSMYPLPPPPSPTHSLPPLSFLLSL